MHTLLCKTYCKKPDRKIRTSNEKSVIKFIIALGKPGYNTYSGCSKRTMEMFELKRDIKMPRDFVEYFETVDGMGTLYPNDSDKNGFLFYPLNALEFIKSSDNATGSHIIVFANYMQHCWNYYVKFSNALQYEIGIMPAKNVFIAITNSLPQFMQYYITDSDELYKYEL